MKDKIYTFIGFAIKAGKVKCGVNAINLHRGNISLLLLCASASENTIKEAQKIAKAHNCSIVLSKSDKLEDLFRKENCKLAAILDSSLAKAIQDNLNEKFVQFGGR